MGSGAYAPTFALFPIIHTIARRSGILWSFWALFACQPSFAVVQRMALSCALMYITASAPNQKSLGGANGLRQLQRPQFVGSDLPWRLPCLHISWNTALLVDMQYTLC
ncbi:hypothetical protein PAXRUDRAFT_736149 [Paxillus rubicundulus Ve08.2h10]|uniref:Uncharacterized protein n=1 Tax=Paxillus rubicundulus Ve08.2h10 TaxID=930991 RepID=A0A0D0E265_9AGAM|nr:hypothetical protein PAXRUDRAFT_736149 [Paxillus rubicundulus Ve08.2h10]